VVSIADVAVPAATSTPNLAPLAPTLIVVFAVSVTAYPKNL